MATLTFSYDTGSVPLSKIVDAFATAYKYSATIPDPANPPQGTLPNPETKANFARRMVKQHIVDIVKSQDLHVARSTAESSVTAVALT